MSTQINTCLNEPEWKMAHPILWPLLRRFYPKLTNDRKYLELKSWIMYGKKFNIDNPKTFNEKCAWLKLYYRKPIFTSMVDKYEAKQFVSERIGDKYVIPCYGVWDHFDEIDFDKLPNQFVLKCTHDSGSVIVCKDKATFDKAAARKKLEEGLRREYFMWCREWPYKHVKRRIVAEKYIDNLGSMDSVEFKVTCCNGKVKFVTVCGGIAHAANELRSNDHYVPETWVKLDWYAAYKPANLLPEKPVFIDEMVELCEKLSKDVPYLRVDWYEKDGNLLFGEMTFYTWGGFCNFRPESFNETLGDWIELPKEKIIND